MIKKASPSAIKYSVKSIYSNENSSLKNGTYITILVIISDRTIAPNRKKFCFLSLNSEMCCERMLYEWNISAIDIVKNAIVIPSVLSVISQ